MLPWFLCALTAIAPNAVAQTAVETVVISARVPDPVGNDAFSVSTLAAEDLRGSVSLDIALGQLPGLSLFRRNSSLSAHPTTQGVSLRALAPSGAGRALVTLDGVPQNNPFGGWVIWSALPPESIAAVQIVRGAGAGPYGAGALTGVIALEENAGLGLVVAGASWGELESRRAAAAGGFAVGKLTFFASASALSSDGWIPVSPEQRGAADDAVTLDAHNAALRVQAEPAPGTTAVARFSVYDERRHSGLVGAGSRSTGHAASFTLAHPQQGQAMGWRLQGWMRKTDFSSVFVRVLAGRVSTLPANHQFTTPALGWGVTAALRGSSGFMDWEIGADMRFTEGESRENFQFVSGEFVQNRVAGGRTFVGGLYAEGARRDGPWLFTAGVRADEWRSSNGHLVQKSRSTGVVSLQIDPPDRSGTVPTARAGLRRNFADGFYARTAAYAGFRPPTLNELYRPFRVGNNVTIANAALDPERLYGFELGAGREDTVLSWNATAFLNTLEAAISNVTIGMGPGVFPNAGFVPAGGTLAQRQNAGDIEAVGFEVAAHWQFAPNVTLDAGVLAVDAMVDGGSQAPQLTGKRPLQAPRWSVTGGVTVTPLDRLTLSFNLRYESARFVDDRNTITLPAATKFDARAGWIVAPMIVAYITGENIFDAQIATTEGGGIVSHDAPRMIRVGLSFAR